MDEDGNAFEVDYEDEGQEQASEAVDSSATSSTATDAAQFLASEDGSSSGTGTTYYEGNYFGVDSEMDMSSASEFEPAPPISARSTPLTNQPISEEDEGEATFGGGDLLLDVAGTEVVEDGGRLSKRQEAVQKIVRSELAYNKSLTLLIEVLASPPLLIPTRVFYEASYLV